MVKPQLWCTLFFFMVVLTPAFRVVKPKRHENDETKTRQGKSSIAKQSNSINATAVLKVVNPINLENVLVKPMEGVVGINWNSDIGNQISNLAVKWFGGVMGTANPLLGIAFTIFSGLFGLSRDADPEAMFFKKVEEMIKLQVKGAISSWYNDYKQDKIAAIMGFLQKEKTWEDWGFISNKIELQFLPMFNRSCWTAFNPENNSACLDYRRDFGGASALVTEIEFTRLAVSFYLSLKDINHPSAVRLPDEFGEAARLLYGHLHTWWTYRLRSSNFRRGQWKEAGPGYTIVQGQDAFVHDLNANRDDKDLNPPGGGQFTGAHCMGTAMNHRRRAYYPPNSGYTYQQWGRRRAPQEFLDGELNNCLNQWKNQKVKGELDSLRRQVNALVASSLHIRNSNETRYLIQDGTGRGSCHSGRKPSRSACRSTALEALRGLKPIRGMLVGCWSHVPAGCTVQSRGDWAIHYNTCSGASNNYLNVCIRG